MQLPHAKITKYFQKYLEKNYDWQKIYIGKNWENQVQNKHDYAELILVYLLFW